MCMTLNRKRMTMLAAICIIVQPLAAEPSGIFVLTRSSDIDKIDSALSKKFVAGVTIYSGWRAVEPKKGQYNFSVIDKAFAAAEKYKKPVILATPPGRWYPGWISNEGVRFMSFQHVEKNMTASVQRSDETSPVPWDDAYLTLFSSLVHSLAMRYRGNPRLAGVMVTGPACANGLEANMASQSDAELAANGFSVEMFTAAWKRMMDVFAHEFPDTPFHIALHPQFGSKQLFGPARSIDAYGMTNYPGRYSRYAFYLTHEPWFAHGNIAVDILTNDLAATPTHLQLIQIYSVKKRPAEEVAQAFENGIRVLGTKRIEVFFDDIMNPGYAPVFEKYASILTGGK